jgi:hypothetical protein
VVYRSGLTIRRRTMVHQPAAATPPRQGFLIGARPFGVSKNLIQIVSGFR